ncbi:MAG: hypothetical protein IH867_12535 [Chloroflexi bacterium]|nr:hypothetical protein [Chloroflexota bacterium]
MRQYNLDDLASAASAGFIKNTRIDRVALHCLLLTAESKGAPDDSLGQMDPVWFAMATKTEADVAE